MRLHCSKGTEEASVKDPNSSETSRGVGSSWGQGSGVRKGVLKKEMRTYCKLSTNPSSTHWERTGVPAAPVVARQQVQPALLQVAGGQVSPHYPEHRRGRSLEGVPTVYVAVCAEGAS